MKKRKKKSWNRKCTFCFFRDSAEIFLYYNNYHRGLFFFFGKNHQCAVVAAVNVEIGIVVVVVTHTDRTNRNIRREFCGLIICFFPLFFFCFFLRLLCCWEALFIFDLNLLGLTLFSSICQLAYVCRSGWCVYVLVFVLLIFGLKKGNMIYSFST